MEIREHWRTESKNQRMDEGLTRWKRNDKSGNR